MMGGFGGMGGWGVGMGLGWIAVIGLVIWGLGFATRRREDEVGLSGAHASRGADGPLAMLDERYAKGELDTETYRRMRRELGG